MTSRMNVKLVKTKESQCGSSEVKDKALLFSNINFSRAVCIFCLFSSSSLCVYFETTVLTRTVQPELSLSIGGSAATPALSAHGEIKLQQTPQFKWEVQSYSVKAIKTKEARLSLHKLPEMESMGKYTEAHNINRGLFPSLCVLYVQSVLLCHTLAMALCFQ